MENLINIINQNIAYIVIGLSASILVLLIIIITLIISNKKLKKRYKRLMRGVTSKNLEELINSKLDEIEKTVVKADKAIDECKVIREEMKSCVNKVAIMRYKAFADVGSDLSFSIAILDSYNDGVIITGIYSRQDSITYAKPVDKGISRYDLSEEEIHVLNEAINKK
ncbi:MAG: DUF4446 family protein [Clostridium sp.]|nr:DUF4446 family protein [Clostridium sp.]